MKRKTLCTMLLATVVTVLFLPLQSSADDVFEDSLTIVDVLRPEVPRPEIELFSSDISEEAVASSTELYNNFLSVDPELFLLTDEGIGRFNYRGTPTDDEWEYLENKAYEITKDCTSAYEKIFAVVEYVAKNVCYDYDYYTHHSKEYSEIYHNPYDVLVNGSAVCLGYSLTTATLLQIADVACVCVHSPDHCWNMAYDGERWIMFDTTWISGGKMEYGVLNRSDDLWLNWFDFTLEQANGNENHLIESLPVTIDGGKLTNFPRYTKKSDIELPSSVNTIADYVYFPTKIDTLIIPESVESIGKVCFYYSDIDTIYYEGSEAEFKDITIGAYNSGITNCKNIIYADDAAKAHITAQPENTIGAVGESVSVSLTAECANSNISYRWYTNDEFSNIGGTLVDGAETATYEFTPGSEGVVYLYAEVVSRDDSVSGKREVVTNSIPICVEIFKEIPAEITCIGRDARYIRFEEAGHIVGTGEVIADCIDYNNTTELYVSSGIISINGGFRLYNLKKITVESGNKNFYVDEYGALIDDVNKRIIKFPTTDGAIDNYIMPEDIIEIAPHAFHQCKIKEVTMSPCLKTIGDYAFWNCNYSARYFIPATVEEIGSYAFAYNYGLRSVYFFGNVPEFGTDVFKRAETSSEITICCAHGTDWTTPTWTASDGIVYKTEPFDPEIVTSPNCCGNEAMWELENGVLTISGKGAVWDYTWNNTAPWNSDKGSITTVVVEEGITHIGDYCFYKYANLTSIELPNSLKSIGNNVFWNCNGIKGITLPKNLTSIGLYAFAYCYGLSEPVVIPASVTDINNYAFNNCTLLTEVYFRGDVPTSWGTEVIPNTVTIYYPEGNTSGWTTPTWAAPDGTVYNTMTYVPEADETFSVSGNVTSYGDTNAEVTVILYDSDGNTVDSCVTTDGTYSLTAPNGTYTMKVSKANHVTREYDIIVDGGDVTCDAEIHLKGDINGDGKINTSDVGRANSHAKGTATLTDYAFACADVNGDGKINTSDVGKINSHVKGINPLW